MDEWERSVNARDDVCNADKAKLILRSSHNRLVYASPYVSTCIIAFYVLVSSFVELLYYSVELSDFTGKYVLSERLSQDPIENYFGQLRSKEGGANIQL